MKYNAARHILSTPLCHLCIFCGCLSLLRNLRNLRIMALPSNLALTFVNSCGVSPALETFLKAHA